MLFRHTSAKAGCFSPKTSKSGKRRSFKGLLRRLSGGKDQVREEQRGAGEVCGTNVWFWKT